MKVSELEGDQLDDWVARANGWTRRVATAGDFFGNQVWMDSEGRIEFGPAACYDPSHDWMLGGPIIERERIAVEFFYGEWAAHIGPRPMALTVGQYSAGPTPLIAVMRAYVASRYGEEVPAG